MKPKVIVVDGKVYQSVNDMPPEVREKYEQAMRSLEDADGNGVPDILENITTNRTVVNTMKFVVDGKEFNSPEDLPPEVRAKYEEALGKLDANRNGIPDFVEGLVNATNQTANISTSFGAERLPGTTSLNNVPSARTPQDQTLPLSQTITPDTSNGWRLVLSVIALLGLCVLGAAGVWYFFLR